MIGFLGAASPLLFPGERDFERAARAPELPTQPPAAPTAPASPPPADPMPPEEVDPDGNVQAIAVRNGQRGMAAAVAFAGSRAIRRGTLAEAWSWVMGPNVQPATRWLPSEVPDFTAYRFSQDTAPDQPRIAAAAFPMRAGTVLHFPIPPQVVQRAVDVEPSAPDDGFVLSWRIASDYLEGARDLTLLVTGVPMMGGHGTEEETGQPDYAPWTYAAGAERITAFTMSPNPAVNDTPELGVVLKRQPRAEEPLVGVLSPIDAALDPVGTAVAVVFDAIWPTAMGS